MKAISFLTLLFLPFFGQSQIAASNLSMQRVEIGCSEGRGGSFAYSSASVDRLVKYYIPNALQVQNSYLAKEGNNYYIKSEVFYAPGWGTAVVLLESDGSRLYIGPGSCTHQCVPVLHKGCLYRSEVTSFEPCLRVTCSCADGGETSAIIEAGDMRSLNLVALSLKNLKSLCD